MSDPSVFNDSKHTFFSFRDIMSIYKEPPPGMFVVPDPHDMTKVSISNRSR